MLGIIRGNFATNGLCEYPAIVHRELRVEIRVRVDKPAFASSDPRETIDLPTGPNHYVGRAVAVDVIQRKTTARGRVEINAADHRAIAAREAHELVGAIIEN